MVEPIHVLEAYDEIDESFPRHTTRFMSELIARALAKKLAAYRVDAPSDEYGQIHSSDREQGGGRCIVLVAEGEGPAAAGSKR